MTSIPTKNHRVLIVDDNPSIHADFRKIFRPRTKALPDIDDFDLDGSLDDATPDGLRFDSAHQGDDAVQMTKKAVEQSDRYSLAFVDMRMPPGMDGLQTISELWKIDPELQIVICTAYSDHSWEESVAVLGHTENLLILKKPFDDVEVLQIAVALTCKWDAAREASLKRRELEELVRARTAELERVAMHDGLTGLANRTKFNERLARTLEKSEVRNETAAVLLIDLDQFKIINDTMGHPAGDELIRVVGQRLSAAVGANGLVARFGGDEFAIVLDGDPDLTCVQSIADRILSTVADPVHLDGIPFCVTASIGISMTPDGGICGDDLIRNADIALYRAKGEGRDCARHFEKGMDQQIRLRQELENSLRSAVENKEFVLHYQPLLSPTTQQVCSFEALLRWQHPQHGIVSPDKFIPMAEESGLIRPIGDWVLSEACQQALTWPEHVRVAVNVSAVQFRGGALPSSVKQALDHTGLPGHRLEIEITESVLLTDSIDALEQLHALRNMGVKIALDDFGTGYSSLSYLRAFPFDKLKMDRSFVRNLHQSDGMALVNTIADLGKCLGMVTTAEGIETEQQLDYVIQQGFTEVQGFLYGRPIPSTSIMETHFAKALATTNSN
ncbi:EAL domain-containing protein [Rhodopirellula halodulae]|uniref:EAL domain-containing protein n=1 Tax=Rhodopirellula halodulae TaxID=2894198 RepID=UPI001E4EE44E|nr:EAL domain-containing protein [Rhodopirellula sp. JC737]MCC9658694.1 EAL domain-containing protein [Rhodopirellula sp. JC737]